MNSDVIFQNARDAMFVGDATTRMLVEANPAAVRLLGIPKEKILTMRADELHPEEVRQQTMEAFARHAEGSAEEVESLVVNAKGEHIPVIIRTSTLQLEGRPHLLGIFRDVSTQKRQAEQLIASNRMAAALSKAAMTLLQITDPAKRFEYLLQHARDITNSRYGFLGYIDPETGDFVSPSMTKDIWEECRIPTKEVSFKEFKGIWARVLTHKEFVLCNDPPHDPRSVPPPYGHVPIPNFLGVPCVSEGKVVGMLALANKEGGYTKEDKELLGEYSQLVTVAILDHHRQQEKDQAEAAMLQISQGVSAETGQQFFHSMSRHLADVLGADFAFIGELIPGGESDRIQTIALCADKECVENIIYDLKGTPCENVVGRQGICSYVREVQQQFPEDRLLQDMGVEGYAGIPLRGPSGRVLGLMGVLSRRPLLKTTQIESTLKIFAARAAAELERIQADAVLKASEERFRAIYEHAPVMIGGFDKAGKVILWNRELEKNLGWTKREAMDSENILAEVYRDSQVYQKIMEIIGRLDGVFHEYPNCAKDGSERIQMWANFPLADGSIIAFGFDTTERKRIERENAERSKIAELGAEVGIVLSTGQSLEEMLQQCAEAFVTHLSAAFARIWTLHDSESILELQASAGMYTHLDGSHGRIPMGQYKIGQIAEERRPHLTNQVIGDPRIPEQEWAKREGMVAFAGHPLVVAGKVVGVMAMFAREPLSNVTLLALASVADEIAIGIERKRSEGRLRDSEEKYRTIFEGSPLGIFHLNMEGVCTACNQSFSQIIGVPREKNIGFNLRKGLKDKRMKKAVEEAYAGRTGHFEGEYVPVTSGNKCHVNIELSPVRSDAGKIIGVVGICQDFGERKRLEEELSRAQRLEAAGQVAGQISHDFNNLLSPLMAYPDLIRMECSRHDCSGKVLSCVEQMQSTANQMAEINQQLLTLGRRGHYAQEVLALDEVLDKALSAVSLPSGVSLHREFAAGLLPIKGGLAQLNRVFTNLLYNAFEAMAQVGSLEISLSNVYLDKPLLEYETIKKGEYVLLRFSDSGCGMESQVIGRIFEPFFTTKKTDRKRGSGLGLSVVRAVMEDQNGYIDVQSEVGHGTTFSLYFPVTREAGLQKEDSALVFSTDSERVLVVDDDPIQREVLTQLLTRLGYGVHAVESGEAAVAFVEDHPQDLVVLDMVMDGIDGTETYRRIVAKRPGQKAVILSGYAASERVAEAQRLGAGEYIPKPVEIKTLAAAIRRELDS